MGEIAEQVVAILAAQALIAPSEVRLEATAEELGLDSLGLVEAIFAIEERFGISVPFSPADASDAPGFDTTTVASMIAAVEQLVAQKAA